MKVISLSQEIQNLEKKDFSIKEQRKDTILEEVKTHVSTISKKLEDNISNKKTAESNISKINSSNNLPEIRKVALAKKRTHIILLVALFLSCFSLSVFIGFIGPFLLFK